MAINTEAYSEMISTLQQFLSAANEQCEAMDGASRDLTDNMDGDPHASKQSEALSSCVSKIRNALEGIQPIIKGLKDELDKAQQAGQ